MDDGSHAALKQDVSAATPPRGALSFATFLWASKEKLIK